jgi:hypothetical protein
VMLRVLLSIPRHPYLLANNSSHASNHVGVRLLITASMLSAVRLYSLACVHLVVFYASCDVL